ncbi:hypothetical protein ABZS66_22575 [Dactylosporangium sp. NPDC005572]|uniref:hypothetical protein n=1 Tax=Dactylosporangium sp. NPDC005572 TaxID=3156889 RepID=UPI0033A73AF9
MLDASNVLNTTQSYSVSAWVKANSLTGYQTAVGQGSTSIVDQRGLTTEQVGSNGNTTSHVYDEDGNPTKSLAPSATTEIFGGTPVSTQPTTVIGYNASARPSSSRTRSAT